MLAATLAGPVLPQRVHGYLTRAALRTSVREPIGPNIGLELWFKTSRAYLTEFFPLSERLHLLVELCIEQ